MGNSIDFTEETGLRYPVNKTVSFRLNPVGKTRELIEKHGIIENDSLKVRKAKLVRQYIDRYHRFFIERILGEARIDFTGLMEAWAHLEAERKKEDGDAVRKAGVELSLCQKKYREMISDLFRKDEDYVKLRKNELFTELLPQILSEEEVKDVNMFEDYYTYFSDFLQLRQFIYSPEEKHNTVAYRIVNENFPLWYSNYMTEKMNGKEYEIGLSFPLSSEQINNYNRVITGETDGKKYVKGLNQLISENRDNSSLRLYRKLYKNILSEEHKMYEVSRFESSEEITEVVKLFHEQFLSTYRIIMENIFRTGTGLSGIYVNRRNISKFTHELSGDWKLCRGILDEGKDYYSLEEINDYYIRNRNDDSPDFHAENYLTGASIPDIKDIYDSIRFDELNDIRQNKSRAGELKRYLTEVLHLYNYLRLAECDDNNLNRNESFYGALNEVIFALSDIVSIYNKTRNFITKKLSEIKKVKLNFDCSTLLGGWDVNVERVNNGMFFHDEENGKYYVALYNNAGRKPEFSMTGNGTFKKMFYKYVGQANKMLPKIAFSKKWKEKFNPSDEIIEGYKAKKHIKGDAFDLDFCHSLIDYFKHCIRNYEGYSVFAFRFSDTDSYKDISDFYREIADQGYRIDMLPVSREEVFNAVDNEDLYLFELDNIFMRGKRHGYDRYTEYLKDVFKPDSLNKLDGFASIYYRPKLIEVKKEHRKGSILLNKNTTDGKTIPRDLYFEITDFMNRKKDVLSPEAKKLYDSGKIKYIVCKEDYSRNVRFSSEQFSIHLPMTFNYRSEMVYPGEFNRKVQEYILQNEDVNILSVNRGENNLLYSVLTDRKGKVLESRCYNELTVGNRNVDFREKLTVKEAERRKEREDWQDISGIRNIREGYLSYVVSEIVRTMLEKNACLVMEDLSGSFVSKRQKIEANVYQLFETMILKKLSYIVLKNRKYEEEGSLRKPIQLAPEFSSLEKIGMQHGFVFFLNPAYTSRIDPETGFINLFNFRELTNYDKKIDFLRKFRRIYNSGKTVIMEYDGSEFNRDIRYDYSIALQGKYNIWNNESRKFEEVDVQELNEKAFGLIGLSLELDHEDLKEKICSQKYSLISSSFIKLFLKSMETVVSSRTKIDDEYIYRNPELSKSDDSTRSVDYITSHNMARKFIFGLKQNKFRNIKYSEYIKMLKEGE